MSKQINGRDVYVAPGMRGTHDENRQPIVIDEKDGNKQLDPNCLDHKILIYERETKGWLLDRIKPLVQDEESRFNNSLVVLMLCTAYFEAVEQYRVGKSSHGSSREFFKNSIKRVIDNSFTDKHLDALYQKLRCGLFHNGITKNGVIFNYGSEELIKFDELGVIINPERDSIRG